MLNYFLHVKDWKNPLKNTKSGFLAFKKGSIDLGISFEITFRYECSFDFIKLVMPETRMKEMIQILYKLIQLALKVSQHAVPVEP